MNKTCPGTTLKFDDSVRATVRRNHDGFVTIQWDDGTSSQYRSYRVECDKRWQVAEDFLLIDAEVRGKAEEHGRKLLELANAHLDGYPTTEEVAASRRDRFEA